MEMELNLLTKDLTRYKVELAYNTKLKGEIVENLNFLYSEAFVVSIEEFKKAKQHLGLVEMRIKHYNLQVNKAHAAIERKNKFYLEEMDRFKIAYKNQFRNNVLEFKLRKGKKNDGRKAKKDK